MKTRIAIATATLTTLSCIYMVRLKERATEFERSSSSKELLASSTGLEKRVEDVSISSKDIQWKDVKFNSTRSEHYIVGNKVTTLTGPKGTILSFQPNSFLDKNNKPVSGRVKIVLEECYDMTEILAAKLSTTSDGSLLETAGMINVNAYVGKEKLKLDDSRPYIIQFPKQDNDQDDFKLFYGSWNSEGIIDWKLANEPDADVISVDLVDQDLKQDENVVVVKDRGFKSPDANCFLQICESSLRRGLKISEMDYFNWKLMNDQTLNQWFLANFNPNIEMTNDFCNYGLRTQITFKVKEDGEFLSYYISQSSGNYEYDRVIADCIDNMPPLNLKLLMPAYIDDHACILTFGTKKSGLTKDFVSEFKKLHKDELDKPLKDVSASDLDYFIFSSSELGWINCDRFSEDEGVLVNYEIKSVDKDDCSVSMVFEDMNSVIKGVNYGDKIVFTGVPANKSVKIIGISTGSGQPKMTVKHSNTSKRGDELTVFKPFSILQLQAEFAKSVGV